MIARSVIRCHRGARTCIFPRKYAQACRPARRYSSSHGVASNSHSTASPFGVLGSITNELDRLGPRFEVDGSQIQILSTPGEFYDTLKVGELLDFSLSIDATWKAY